MEVIFISSIVIIGIVIITYLVTKKDVTEHVTEVVLGKNFKFMTKTKFNEKKKD